MRGLGGKRAWATEAASQAPGAVVFGVAAGIRLWLAAHAQFGSEESIFYGTVRELAEGRAFPKLGPPVTGGLARHPGGLFYYLLAPSQFVSATPEAAYAWVALLGAASVWLFWDAIRRSGFGAWGSAVAGLMMAVSPWSVFYADRVWNSNVVGILVAAAFWAAVRMRQRPASRWVGLLVFAGLVMPQVHLSAPVVWVALAALVGFRRINLRWAAVGAAAALVAYGPYLASEFETGFGNLRNYLRESGGRQARVPLVVPLYVGRFLTLDASYFETSAHSIPVTQEELIEATLFGDRCRPFHPLRATALGLSAVLAAAAVISAIRRPEWRRPFGLALAAGVLADMALVGWSGKWVFPHYVQPLLPFLFTVFATLPRRAWVIGLMAVYAVGSLDVIHSVALHMDAKNSLPVHRRVIERLRRDGEPRVNLAFNFQAHPISYQTLVKYDYGGRPEIRPSGVVYVLAETDGAPPPPVVQGEAGTLGRVRLEAVETFGPVTLYRAHP